MRLIVERIEENIAVLEKEDMSHIEVELQKLPEGVREGSALSFDGTAFYLDFEAEAEMRKRINQKHRRAFTKRS